MVVIPKLKKYLGGVYILQIIAIAMGIIILIVFMDQDYLKLLCTIFLSFFVLKAIYTAGEQIYLTNIVDKNEMSLFMGLRQSFMCLGMVLGPIIGGHIYQQNEMNIFMFNVICLLVSSIILSVIRVEYSKGKTQSTQSLLS
jgi:DHA1 family multidrug resistance protein-like MFS transporter